MKKSIGKILEKFGPSNDELLNVGFLSIKGGMNLRYVSTNDPICNNTGTCKGTNATSCTNNICTDTTNSKPDGCSNTGSCAF